MPDQPVNVLVVDDQRMVATALASALADSPGILVAGVLCSLSEVEKYCVAGPFDPPTVWVVDYDLGDGTAIDAMRIVTGVDPDSRTVVMSESSSHEQLGASLTAGCLGLVRKSKPFSYLVHAIHAAARGETAFDARELADLLHAATLTVARTSDCTDLSGRELQILEMLAAGHHTKAIAADLYLSIHTVRNHVRHLSEKLGTHSRLEAVSVAARNGLVTLS